MRHPSLPIVVGSLFLFVAARAPATEPLTEQFSPILVSDPNEASQDIGSGIAADARGNFVAIWQVQDAGGIPSSRVMARRMSFSGAPLTGAFLVNAPSALFSMAPAVASDADGNFIVAWGDNPEGDSQSMTIRARRFDARGVAPGPVIQINALATLADSGPTIAMNHAGDYVIAWSRKGSPSEVVARAFSAEGGALGPEFVVPLLTPENSTLVGLALTTGRKIVVGSTASNVEGGNDFRLQCYDTQGTAVSAATDVGPRTPFVIPGNTGAMTANADGNIFMAWPQLRIDERAGLVSEVQVKIIANDCVTASWSTRPFSGPGGDITVRDIALSLDPTGTKVGVAWIVDLDSRLTSLLQILDEAGTALTEVVPVAGGNDYPLLTAPQLTLRRNRISAAWGQLDVTDAESLTDVFARGFFLGTAPDAYADKTSLEFGEQAVGALSPAREVKIANDGNATLSIGTVTASGDFAVSSNGCASAVAPGATCSIAVTFSPSRSGDRSGTLQINSDSVGGPTVIPLSGTGRSASGGGGGALSWPLLALGFVLMAWRRRRS